jgi:hypothetical protein
MSANDTRGRAWRAHRRADLAQWNAADPAGTARHPASSAGQAFAATCAKPRFLLNQVCATGDQSVTMGTFEVTVSRIIVSAAIALSLLASAPASARTGTFAFHGPAASALAPIAPARPGNGPSGWNRHVVESRTPDPPILVHCPGGQVWMYVFADHGYRCVHVMHHH